MSTIYNFSSLQSLASATSASELLIRLDNSLSGSAGFGKITFNNLEESLGVYTQVQTNSASWSAPYQRTTLTLPTVSGTSGTISSNALSAGQFVVALSGASLTATIATPSNPYDAQIIMWNLRYTTNVAAVSLAAGFRTPLTTLNWTVSANRMDIMAAKYNLLDSKWDVISFAPGYII